ncbi:TPA: radical SAM protein [Clostridioides difficile]
MEQLKNYKFSTYNHKFEIKDNELFLYNALTGGFCMVDKEDAKQIIKKSDLSSDISNLKGLTNDIINELKKGGFIIGKDIDEIKLLKSICNVKRFNVNNSLTLTLMPTTACNFRCPYCYEKDNDYPSEVMSKELMDAIIEHIDTSLTKGGFLNITWYGGEPLLRFDIVKELQTRINKLIKEKELKSSAGMITNGYFLTKNVSDEMNELGIDNIQITLDGTKEINDKKRILSNGKGSFDVITSNLLSINKNIRVAIRINIDKNNIQDAPDLIHFIVKSGISENKNITPYFAIVKDYDIDKGCCKESCYNISDFSKEEVILNKLLLDNGFPTYKIRPLLSSCGAVSPSTLVVEPDGTLQKCWHVAGSKEHSVGNLLNKNINRDISLKNESEWLSWSPFDKDECTKCSILPLCMGGCPYFSIYENPIFEQAKYRCDSQKFNLTDLLEVIAYNHLNKAVAK